MLNCDYLAVLRHGEAYNNDADRRFKAGDPRAFDHAVKIPSSLHDLTSLGREQAVKTGVWLRRRGLQFTHHIVSGYIRALRTAYLLDIPGAEWQVDERLCERDTGILNALTPSGVERHHAAKGNIRHKLDKYRYRPDSGESHLDVDVRVRPAFQALTGRPLVVCHGNVSRVLDNSIIRERSSWDFERYASEPNSIPNCALIEYLKIHKGDGTYYWHRYVSVPWRDDVAEKEVIVPKRYSNDELSQMVEQTLERLSENQLQMVG